MKKILLADDSITIQKVVELTFSEADYQVTCVSNGAQALRKMSEMRPDLILLDVIMPEKNGYEVCEQLKRNPSTSGIPILLLTGTFEPFDKKRADAAGANGHLTKPFESQVLVSKVEELIRSTPTVVSTEEAGVMSVISGGDIYQVDAHPGDGLRPFSPPVAAGLQKAAPGPPIMQDVAEPPDEALLQHPALATPDPAKGGSYVGFADVALEAEDENQIVPDRFDVSPMATPGTIRVRREGLFQGSDQRLGREPVASEHEDASAPSNDVIEGLTGSFEPQFSPHPDEDKGRGTKEGQAGRDAESELNWSPPPEAPPPEAWQAEEPDEQVAPSRSETGSSSSGHPAAMTPEMIELIAEKVVQRMSDRVVREIAWEVIPEVAEAIVRRRIKELEDKGPS